MTLNELLPILSKYNFIQLRIGEDVSFKLIADYQCSKQIDKKWLDYNVTKIETLNKNVLTIGLSK
jgi:hypothetical protein